MPKRRTKGDGGITQRHDHPTCPPRDPDTGERPTHKCRGRWQGTIDVWVDGRKRRKYVYGRTSKEVATKLKQALREKDAGTIVVASMLTGAWLDYWLDNIAARTLRPQTVRGYRSKIDLYIKPSIGSHRLTALRPEHIRQMHDRMRGDGLAEASVRQAHAVLKRALRVAVQEGKLGVSPADRMESPSTETATREQFTVAQAKAVLKAARDDARWWLALFYGLRQGEALGLDWIDVDLDRHVLTIRQTLQTNEAGEHIFGPPKSKASNRTVPLVPVMEARLRLLWEAQGRPSAGLLFHDNGGPIHPRRDWQAWRDLIDRAAVPPSAQLPYIALHAARNTAASLLEAAGVPDRLVAQILGHGQVRVTHGYQSAEVARMAEAFESAARFLELE